jgi:long-subunit fatty acid transport protein
LQYNFENGMSVFGGLRAQRTDAKAEIAFARNYTVEAEDDWGIGYVAGVAYERPDIALRVSLTYSSEISHANDVIENADILPTNRASVAEFETPQSVNLEFQTGIAEDTLLFGGVRWVDWSDFDLSPQAYSSAGFVGQPLLSYVDDVTTYSIGLGRRLSDTWAVSGSLSYEENTGNLFTNLGPNDGATSIGLAAVYTQGGMSITTGIRYAWIGDTTTAVQGNPAAAFNDNNALAIGVRVGYSF